MNEHIEKLLAYLWQEEMQHFQELFNIEGPVGNDTLEDWILICDKNGWTGHIFYSMMKVKQAMLEVEEA